jgi:hypothetical protein
MIPMRRRLPALAFAGAVAVVVFQVACPIAIAAQRSHLDTGLFSTQSDAARYRTVAATDGRPYRDFDVEYPPVAVGMFHAIGPRDFGDFRERLLLLQVACQGLIVLLLFREWGRRAGWSYLVLSTPMLFVVYTGFDLVAVAIAAGGAALVRRRHAYAGALAWVVGAFTKLWPVVLLPGLLVRRQARAFATAVATGFAGLVVWGAWGGASAIGQVVTYRGARGWEYESLPGSLLRLVTRDALRFENGSWRLGRPPAAFGWTISLLLVGAVTAIWWLAAHHRVLPDGLAETAAITAVLVFGTLLSPQFVIWPLPFVAIAAASGVERPERWAGAASVLTLLDWFWFDPYRPAQLSNELVILGRNAALVGLLVVAVLELRSVTPRRAVLAAA